MSTNFRKHELVVVMRHKGWKGDESRLKKEYIESWLLRNDVTDAEVARIVKMFHAGTLGGNGAAADAGKGLTQKEVLELIEAAFNRGGAAADEEQTKAWIAEAVAKAQPQKIVIDSAASTKAQIAIIEGTHPLFEKVLKLVVAGVNVLLVGPAGCGKTTLAHQIAKALKRKFGMLSCTSGASESQLTGWLLPVGGKSGEFSYVPSEFVRLYEEGNSVFLFDEFDAADPNMLLVVNSALANGSLHVPQRHKEPRVERGKNVAMIAAANTFGSGADMVYAGRNQLDAATLDRFYVVQMDYDSALEQRIGDAKAVEWATQLRAKVQQHRVRRVVSTRTIMKMTAALKAGISFQEARRDALAGWTRDELSKVQEA
jgi:cobaltochelatase CobS